MVIRAILIEFETLMYVLKNITCYFLIEMEAETPAELARTEDPGLSIAREAAERRTKTKTATSCGNVFETNFLLASAESVCSNGNQRSYYTVKANDG